VLLQLDYCNSVLASIPLHLVRCLQSVMKHGSSSRHQSAITSHRTYANYTGWWTLGGQTSSWPFLFINVFTAWHRHISPMNFIIQQSQFRRHLCLLRLTSCLFPIPDSQPMATELFQLPPFGSGTVFHSTSHPRRHFQSSALAWRHTSSNCVIHNIFVVPAKLHRHSGHVNCFYLFTYKWS